MRLLAGAREDVASSRTVDGLSLTTTLAPRNRSARIALRQTKMVTLFSIATAEVRSINTRFGTLAGTDTAVMASLTNCLPDMSGNCCLGPGGLGHGSRRAGSRR